MNPKSTFRSNLARGMQPRPRGKVSNLSIKVGRRVGVSSSARRPMTTANVRRVVTGRPGVS